ncbi:phosphoinositide 3-kinase regulatory subunit 4-like protein [Chrysochromulina tobinii]|uniref:Phosphoinositide 3-kinase regulatory subunit 4-like protein n=1 Tax=Chrysochromulina tobinii TaxID=1460289 RepID=A0A0M0LSN6_9EUKA|nr:phosphoinositide 3-kinase regulatory subunit 4-like protein [Chrysochromulina tobinii]|eukprot:KOO53768.1 phosphoinositide 3-kinase regulatory subunit 4-like protein [Chrysochromulina sp. CCMP291]
MGNQLASLSHQPDNTIALPEGVTFEDRLGGGQFLRTLKCGSEDGALVVKVYSKRESRTALSSYEEMLAVVRERLTLNGAPNVMPFRWFEETPQAAYLVRQYFHSNLLERMSTPPFLTVVEKRWLAFQLLQALQQCHAVGVCHGDVKAENIMVTSWNWLFLCDLANYKPSILPQDDPTIFNYFFATSRRACALAPERAREPLDAALGRVKEAPLRELLELMTRRNPEERPDSARCLKLARGTVFEESFYTFAFDFFKGIRLMDQHAQAAELCDHFEQAAAVKGVPAKPAAVATVASSSEGAEGGGSCLVLLVGCFCASIRNVTSSGLKLRCMQLLLRLALRCEDAVRTHRVLPYLIALLSDPTPLVRAEAIALTSALLASVETLQPSDERVMPDYVLPAVSRCAHDPEELVRCALARTIAELAETAKRFIEISQWMRVVTLRRDGSGGGLTASALGGGRDSEAPAAILQSFDAELGALRADVARVVIDLVTGDMVASSSSVRRSLLDDLTRLAIFMSRQLTNDVLLPHFISFLNDRDAALRVAFYESIAGVCAFVGIASLEAFVLPCILQSGLYDVEEAVVAAALHSLCRLADVHLHTRASLIEISTKVAPLLTHPNTWVRHAAVAFFGSVGQQFAPVETFCLLRPVLRPFLARPLLSLETKLLLAALKPPASRLIFDLALACAAEQQQLHANLLTLNGGAVLGVPGAVPGSTDADAVSRLGFQSAEDVSAFDGLDVDDDEGGEPDTALCEALLISRALIEEFSHSPIARQPLPGQSVTASGVAFCMQDAAVALATSDGTQALQGSASSHVSLLAMERFGAPDALISRFSLSGEQGCLLNLGVLGGGGAGGGGGGGGGLVLYTTESGEACAIDPRSGGAAWRVRCGRPLGLMQAHATDAAGQWLVLGSSTGHCVLWDLRYSLKLKLATWQCPNASRVHTMLAAQQAGLLLAGSLDGTVRVWRHVRV